MASKTTLNAKNLETLGAERLAQLLIEVSTGNTTAKRRLRLALAGAGGPKEAAHHIAKDITRIARANASLTQQNRKQLTTDLKTLHHAIMEQVAPHDPTEALSLLWRFMELTTSTLENWDDSDGEFIDIFDEARVDMGGVAEAAKPEPRALAERVFQALQENDFAQYDELIFNIAPALGPEGTAHLKNLVEDLGRTPIPVPPEAEWEVVGWGSGGKVHAHEIEESSRQSTVRMALRDIADVQGDVDGFIAQRDKKTHRIPGVAAEIATRLLEAGRAEEALGFIERAEVGENRRILREWQDARLAVLEALDRKDEAQVFRWECFEQDLLPDYLRTYLKGLPDFEDIEAEERALAHAAAHHDLIFALDFFLDWPSHDRAARLLIDRHDEIDGDWYELFVPAAEALSENHPLAATLALRAMIDFALNEAKSSRYDHAARHLADCTELAQKIKDFAPFDGHDAYVARLKKEHGRKSGFWSRVEG